MSNDSGKFVLRVPPHIHSSLKKEARDKNVSLNQIVNSKLGNATEDKYDKIKSVFKNELLGIAVFGSTVRGEQRANSDIDLLIVLDNKVPVVRSLYHTWDEKVLLHLGDNYSPQFSHIPKDLRAASSLWLEVALEGEIVFDPKGKLRKAIYSLKDLIASGVFTRKLSHGHPYWIRTKVDYE